MDDAFALKPISAAAVPEAIGKAEHYRLLNEPEQAESICLDVLEADPDNQAALVVLILALTDQFDAENAGPAVLQAQECLGRLHDDYQRCYYGGLVLERRARAFLRRRLSRPSAYACLRRAMDEYEKAERLRPEGEDSALLRWNACLRTLRREQLAPPAADEREQPLE